MRQVERIDKPQENDKPVKFTHYLSVHTGWENTGIRPSDYERVVYLGRCTFNGDMFSAYSDVGTIIIFKGHLNSGRY